MANDEIDRLLSTARELEIRPRSYRWTHLPLCVLDAVFSIGVRYSGVKKVCYRYATHVDLIEPSLPARSVAEVVGTQRERPIDVLAGHGRELGPTRLANEVLNNRGRTSTRNGILKADAAVRYAAILADAGIHRIDDVNALLNDPGQLEAVEHQLGTVPGHGKGARLNYLWMLAGADHHVKPDRMILRWLHSHLERSVTVPEARELLIGVADRLGCTAWELDHAIWRRQSGRG